MVQNLLDHWRHQCLIFFPTWWQSFMLMLKLTINKQHCTSQSTINELLQCRITINIVLHVYAQDKLTLSCINPRTPSSFQFSTKQKKYPDFCSPITNWNTFTNLFYEHQSTIIHSHKDNFHYSKNKNSDSHTIYSLQSQLPVTIYDCTINVSQLWEKGD